ncbi:hypothetical protein IFM89_025794 [Coptis chinensis]|uniref:Uncharacterized protein n=1 Tax=Coptis chinensis TaxID=261450 RepID=A0A835LMP3_9MAGN|nr:hypothetical protein IFM89_025794 [Coptis chinensis]
MVQKINGILVNQKWVDAAIGWRNKILQQRFFDHSPIIGWFTAIPKPHNIPFRFKKPWIKHESLKERHNGGRKLELVRPLKVAGNTTYFHALHKLRMNKAMIRRFRKVMEPSLSSNKTLNNTLSRCLKPSTSPRRYPMLGDEAHTKACE